MPTLSVLKSKFQDMVRRGDNSLAEFKLKLDENPSHAFQWGDGVMLNTVERQVGQHYLASIDAWELAKTAGQLSEHQPKTEDEVVEFIRKSVLRSALQYARFAHNQSTSVCANRMKQYEAGIYADLAADWEILY